LKPHYARARLLKVESPRQLGDFLNFLAFSASHEAIKEKFCFSIVTLRILLKFQI